MTEIYIPGVGLTDTHSARLNAASQEYDRRLTFKLNPMTQQHCSYMEMPRGWDPPEIPVKGWNHLPSVDELLNWCRTHDAEKHGDSLRLEMNKRNEKRRADNEFKRDERAGETAEYMAHILEKAGEHPWHTSRRNITRKK